MLASTLPWKTGAAIAGATIYVIDPEGQVSDFASTGPISVKLVK